MDIACSFPCSREFLGKEVVSVERHTIENDLVFFSPGQPGSVFTFKTGHVVSDTDIHDMAEHLKYDTGQNIGYVENRRLWERPPESSDFEFDFF